MEEGKKFIVQSCASSQANYSSLTWKVVEAVHARGSFIFMQLFATGRAARPSVLKLDDPSFPYVGAGDIPLADRNHERPRPMTVLEIKEYIQLFATAASNAVNEAGFDGVEIHGANGYLVDQFLQTTANNRPDEYGGSINNRIRFSLEVVDAVASAVGPQRVGFRISPWSDFQGQWASRFRTDVQRVLIVLILDMRMPDPLLTFRALVSRLHDTYPDLGYLHAVKPRIAGAAERESKVDESNDDLCKIWGSRPYLAAGGFTREDAIQTAEEKGGLVVFGRHFISNVCYLHLLIPSTNLSCHAQPDLPTRLLKGLPLTPYDRATFYIQDRVKGYTDCPFSQVDIQVVA